MRTLKELFSLEGRVALITGAAGHIGGAISDGLAELGASLILVDRNISACIELSSRIEKKWHVAVDCHELDLEKLSEQPGLRERLTKRLGRLDILVNCAAFVGTTKLEGWNVPFEEQSVDSWRRAVEVNLTAPFILTQTLTPLLAASGHGSVINFASIYGMLGPDLSIYEGTTMHNAAAYGAAKAGLLQFTRWLATVLAPSVRVNAITPGGIERGQPACFVENYVKRTPMGRMGIEEDIKGAVAYLASDLSSYVTGQNIVVDGGWSAW